MKKETFAHAFSCEFCQIFKYTFLTEHLRATASDNIIFYSNEATFRKRIFYKNISTKQRCYAILYKGSKMYLSKKVGGRKLNWNLTHKQYIELVADKSSC